MKKISISALIIGATSIASTIFNGTYFYEVNFSRLCFGVGINVLSLFILVSYSNPVIRWDNRRYGPKENILSLVSSIGFLTLSSVILFASYYSKKSGLRGDDLNFARFIILNLIIASLLVNVKLFIYFLFTRFSKRAERIWRYFWLKRGYRIQKKIRKSTKDSLGRIRKKLEKVKFHFKDAIIKMS